MNFDFTDDQHDIKRTARDLLTKRSTLGARARGRRGRALRRRAVGRALRARLAGHRDRRGATAARGSATVELAILLEELGYASAVTPFLGSALAGLAIQAAGSDEQRERWLPGLASGELRGALGMARDGAGELVPDAVGRRRRRARGGRRRRRSCRRPTPTSSRSTRSTRRAATRRVSGAGRAARRATPRPRSTARRSPSRRSSSASASARSRWRSPTSRTASSSTRRSAPTRPSRTAARRCCATPRARARRRTTPAWAADAEPDRLPEAAALAKARGRRDAGREVTASNIQVHGGIGFTWEADVHWLFKRAQMDSALLGGAGRIAPGWRGYAAARLAAAAA